MNIESYDDLLAAAQMQSAPQRLLFVFTKAELPDDSDENQQKRFLANEGGSLLPIMCVDKLPRELGHFSALVEESHRLCEDWDIVFTAAISGVAGTVPSSDEADQPLEMMVEAIKNGNVRNFVAFNSAGEIVTFI